LLNIGSKKEFGDKINGGYKIPRHIINDPYNYIEYSADSRFHPSAIQLFVFLTNICEQSNPNHEDAMFKNVLTEYFALSKNSESLWNGFKNQLSSKYESIGKTFAEEILRNPNFVSDVYNWINDEQQDFPTNHVMLKYKLRILRSLEEAKKETAALMKIYF